MSSILRRAVYPVMSGARIFPRSIHAGEVCALTYHGIFPPGFVSGGSPTDETLVTAEQFRRQLQFLKARYQLITPEAFREWCNRKRSLPDRAVMLTCDDGLLNVLTEMVPILREEGAKCLFFVTGASAEEGARYLWYEELHQILAAAGAERVAAVCGKQNDERSIVNQNVDHYWQSLLRKFSRLEYQERGITIKSLATRLGVAEDWHVHVRKDSATERRYRLLNRTELRQLVAAGMTVGAHTMSHPVLSEMSPDLAENEMRECRSRLESCLQEEIWALAYPFGDESSTGRREAEMAERAGYSCAFVNCGGGRFGRATPRFGLPRAHVTSAMAISELEARLTGFFEPLRERVWGVPAQREAE